MRISIFGAGYVGVVASGCLASSGHEVVAVDISPEKVEMIARGQSPIVEAEIGGLIEAGVKSGLLRATTDVDEAVRNSDVSFISVGTPSAPNGAVAMGAVRDVSAAIGRALRGKAAPHTVIMRSTVPPGTAEELVIPILEAESQGRHGEAFHYYSNPEFLREGTSVRDFHNPPYTLVGARPGDTADVLRAIYAGIDAPLHVAPYRVIESVKYLANAYHAVKLAFANDAAQVLAAYGVDAREAFRLFREDRVLNVSPAYLRPGFAFGGSCLPKDIRSFLALAQARDVAAPFLGQVMPSNQAIIDAAYRAIVERGRQRVAMFGLAFKAGTDDLRESPFVVLAERLIGRGYELRIYDANLHMARLLGSNRSYIEREIPHIDGMLVDSPAAALDGAGIAVVGHIAAEDQPALLAALAGQTVFDLAGLDALERKSGIDYRVFC